MNRSLRAVDVETRPVNFWCFAGPVLLGNLATVGAVWLTRKAFADEPERTQKTAAAFTGIAAFWLTAGLAWIAIAKKP